MNRKKEKHYEPYHKGTYINASLFVIKQKQLNGGLNSDIIKL